MTEFQNKKSKAYKKWCEEEIEVLKSLYGKIPAHEIAKILNRPLWGVYYKANKLNLRSKIRGSNIPQLLKPFIHKIYENYLRLDEE